MKNNIAKNPRIDILIPCYNSAYTIKRTLESISSQSYSNFRVVLVDNNSVDKSVEIYLNFNDRRFECVRYKETVSLGANLNRCLEHVKSKYFCIMHTDDAYKADYLAVMVSAMESNQDVELAVCNVNIINSKSKKIFSLKNLIKRSSLFSKNIKYSGDKGVIWISNYNKIIAPTAFYRKALISKVGQFNEQLKFTLDWEYYFRLFSAGGSILYLNNILFNYRLHDNQESAALIVSMEKYQEMHSLLVIMNSYTDTKMKRKILRYKYFIFTIIFDVMSDVVHMRIMQGFGKIKFCIKLFGNNMEKI